MDKNYMKSLLIICMAALPYHPYCVMAGEKPDTTWNNVTRQSRDTFRPNNTQEKPFDLSRSLLKNPSLVEGFAENGMPASWRASVDWKSNGLSRFKIVKDEEILFQGKPSTRVTFGPFEERTLWQLSQNIEWKDIDLRGKKMRLTYYIYRAKPYTDASCDFICRARLPKVMPGKETLYARPTALDVTQTTLPGAWTRVVTEGKVDTEASFFNFTLQNRATEDQFWLSGFLLEVAE